MNCFVLVIVGQTYVKFTVLLEHVVAATPRTALRHSSAFAIQLIQNFLRKYTRVNPEKVLDLSDRFRHLEVGSRLEILFEGKPKKFVVPSYSVYNHQSEDGIVIFELETRVTDRYIPPVTEYQEIEIGRTDFLNQYLNNPDEREQFLSRTEEIGPRTVSVFKPSVEDSHYQTPKRHLNY
jgi:hypothetical protein